MVTLKPLAWSSFASDAEIIHLPREELTPPVTKMYLVVAMEDAVTGFEGTTRFADKKAADL